MMNKKLKLVILDDDQAFIDYITPIVSLVPALRLKKATTDPKEALVYLLKKRADILLLDVDMPLLDGFEVMKQLEHLIKPGDLSTPRLFVVLCSGFEVNPQECFDNSAAYYLQKPLTVEKLIKANNAIQEGIVWRSARKREGKRKKRPAAEEKTMPGEAFLERDLVTIKEAEGILGVSRWKITDLRDKGELTTLEKDGRVRLIRKEVEAVRSDYSVRKGKV